MKRKAEEVDGEARKEQTTETEAKKEETKETVEVKIECFPPYTFPNIEASQFPNCAWVQSFASGSTWPDVFKTYKEANPKFMDAITMIPRSIAQLSEWDWNSTICENQRLIFIYPGMNPRTHLGFRYDWIVEKKRAWPPCDNFWDDEPINQIAIGVYNDPKRGHCCSGCARSAGTYDKAHDNRFEHMVVLEFKDSKARTGVNKHHLLGYITAQLLKEDGVAYCPFTRTPISDSSIAALLDDKAKNFETVRLDTV